MKNEHEIYYFPQATSFSSFKFNYYISLVQQMGNDFAYNLLCSP